VPGKIADTRLVLSKLELQAALLARAGLKRWEIAAVLGIRKGTVKSQLERVAAKLGPGWKSNASLKWPQLDAGVRQAVRVVKKPAGVTGAIPAVVPAAAPGPAVPGPTASGPATSGVAAGEIAATLARQNISYAAARRALEGELSPEEAAVIHLQGLPSRAGAAYLKKARSVQWHVLLNKGRTLYVGTGARFWLKPAITYLAGNRYIRFLHSDKTEEPYRPWWLPYTSGGRARGTRAAYYTLRDGTAAEYTRSYLDAWISGELEVYVTRLHARMQQRWQALHSIARSAGRGGPVSLPTPVGLLAEARSALGVPTSF